MHLIKPNWSAPKHIHAITTTRVGGLSKNQYQGLNLGDHVNDDLDVVQQNRQLLAQQLGLTTPLTWLTQTHSTALINLSTDNSVDGDAAWTINKQQAAIVMTADCLPVLVTDKQGSFVAAIHAGWRGLCDGIIEKSINKICQQQQINSQDLLVWLGPCIGKNAFEVGGEVRAEFMAIDNNAQLAFTDHGDKYLADLHLLAKQRLAPFKVAEITCSQHCTFSEPELFYSYRRDGQTGRMATLAWIE